ncbi:MAG: tocopherol cyclase family protein [Bdellovibrionota bacterium]
MTKTIWILLALAILPLHVNAESSFANSEADPFNTYRYKPGDKGDWYEWWYYKVVEPQTNEAFFFTYGIVNPGDAKNKKQGTKSMVQAGSFSQKVSVQNDFPIAAFTASRKATEIKIGENTATDRHIAGSVLDSEGLPISWNLDIQKNWAFNAMGWATGMAGVSNIYWYPAQASATMNGNIHFRGRDYELKNAPAYQDRNWGRSFPEWWTWLVSNNFKNSPGTTLAAGGGKPKVFSVAPLFTGLCIGLQHEGKEYIFRTTDGDHMDFEIRWGKWEVSAVNKHHQKIEISAYAPRESFLLLPFSAPQGGTFYDYETLTGSMQVRLYNQDPDSGKWILATTLDTDQAGIEWGSPDPISLDGLYLTGKTLQ